METCLNIFSWVCKNNGFIYFHTDSLAVGMQHVVNADWTSDEIFTSTDKRCFLVLLHFFKVILLYIITLSIEVFLCCYFKFQHVDIVISVNVILWSFAQRDRVVLNFTYLPVVGFLWTTVHLKTMFLCFTLIYSSSHFYHWSLVYLTVWFVYWRMWCK